VIDAFVRVSLVGIEVITIDARVVVASVDTYLRFAEATNRLDLYEKGGRDLPELVEGVTESGTRGGAKGKTKGMLDAVKETFEESLSEHRSKPESHVPGDAKGAGAMTTQPRAEAPEGQIGATAVY